MTYCSDSGRSSPYFADVYKRQDKALASQGADRDNAWIEAEQALMADMPVTPLYYPSYTAVVNEDLVEDVELTASNTFMFKSASVIE